MVLALIILMLYLDTYTEIHDNLLVITQFREGKRYPSPKTSC